MKHYATFVVPIHEPRIYITFTNEAHDLATKKLIKGPYAETYSLCRNGAEQRELALCAKLIFAKILMERISHTHHMISEDNHVRVDFHSFKAKNILSQKTKKYFYEEYFASHVFTHVKIDDVIDRIEECLSQRDFEMFILRHKPTCKLLTSH